MMRLNVHTHTFNRLFATIFLHYKALPHVICCFVLFVQYLSRLANYYGFPRVERSRILTKLRLLVHYTAFRNTTFLVFHLLATI